MTDDSNLASGTGRRRLGTAFTRLLTASAISNIGDGVVGAALPLMVATITRDPVLVAGVTIAGQLPWFLMAVISGAMVDRMDRRRVMVITDLTRAGLMGVLALNVASGAPTLLVIYIVAFGLGLGETFFDSASEAVIPSVVERDLLASANGRRQAAEFVGGSFAGPPIGAFLFALTAALPFVVDAASFAIAAILVATISGSFRPARERPSTLRADIGEGLRWLFTHRVLRTLASMAGITNLFATAIVAVFVLFAQDILGVSEVGYGILLAAIGIGGLAGAFLGPVVVKQLGAGTTLQATVLAQALLVALMGLLSSPYVAAVILFLFGLLVTTWNIVSVTLRQSLTPDALRGRVAGAARLLAWGSQPIGAALGGFIARFAGLRAPFIVAAVAWLLMALVTRPIINNQTLAAAASST